MAVFQRECACCLVGLGAYFTAGSRFNQQSVFGASKPRTGAFSCEAVVDRREFVKASAAVAGVFGTLAAGTALAQAQTPPTTVFFGGTVLTVDERFSEAGAIAIRGNRILAVGTEEHVKQAAGDSAQMADLQGKTLVPGFIDAHTHVVSGSIVDGLMDYVGVARFSSANEVLAHLAGQAEAAAPGTWVAARNFDPAVQDGPEALTFKELDAVSKTVPVFVLNASGHLAYANSAAFRAAGIAPDVPDPDGGEYVRDASGSLTGVMKNMLTFMPVFQANPAMAEIDPVNALVDLTRSWAKTGLTTCSELSLGALTSSAADVKLLRAAGETGRLGTRIRAYPFYPFEDAWDNSGIQQDDGDELIRIAGYKLVADGSNQGYTGLQRDPYLGSSNRGLAYMSPDELKRQVAKRVSQGWKLAIHGNGDAGIDNILDALQAARDAGLDLEPARPRIEHCSILHDDQIRRMKDLGVQASFLIGHVHFWGIAMRDQVFGEQKAQLLDRTAACEREGVPFTLHSDFMVTDPDPLHMIEMAVTRRTMKEPDYVLAPQERISVEAALRAVTINAAYQVGSEHEIGSLEPGKLADFAILAQDPRAVPGDQIKDISVLETWMDGVQTHAA